MSDQLFEISIKLLIIENGTVLALQRYSHQNDLFWDLPGGRITEKEINPIRTLNDELEAEISWQDELKEDDLQLADFSIWPGVGGYPSKGIVYYRNKVPLQIKNIKLSSEHANWGYLNANDCQKRVINGARLETDLQTVIVKCLAEI